MTCAKNAAGCLHAASGRTFSGITLRLAMLLVALPASAQLGTIQLYFSNTGLENGVLSAPPPEYVTHTNPVAAPGSAVYLYATVYGPPEWVGVSLNYTGSAGPVTLVNSEFMGLRRWNINSDFIGSLNGTNETNLVAVQELGLPAPYGLDDLDDLALTGPDGAVHFYLGAVVPTAQGDVFLHVGQGGISNAHSIVGDFVYFGWGDAPLHGSQFGAASSIADLTVVPEPSAWLIGIAALRCCKRGR